MGDGTYAVRYSTTRAGRYVLTVTVGPDSELVGNAPYAVHVSPAAPSPRHCAVRGAGLGGKVAGKVGTAGAGAEGKREGKSVGKREGEKEGEKEGEGARPGHPAWVEVALMDRYGNACARGATMAVEASLTYASGEAVPVTVDTAAAGAAAAVRCAFTPPRAGLLRLTLTSGSLSIGRSPFALKCHPPSPEGKEGKDGSEGGDGCDGCDGGDGGDGFTDDVASPPADLAARWEAVARTEFEAIDGDATGWDSAEEEALRHETAEERYAREHPDVAVVDNLEDIWRVGRYQQERREIERRCVRACVRA